MTKCDGCGEPIGHAKTILAEYHDEKLDKKDHYFGSNECKREFEKAHNIDEEAVECGDCGYLVKKSNMVKKVVNVQGIQLEEPFHKECAEKMGESN